MYDIAIIGAGISGASFAYKSSKYAKVLLIEGQDYDSQIPVRTNIFAHHDKPYIDDIFWNDKVVFPRLFTQLNYKSEKYDGLINASEFGSTPIGNIASTEIFLEKMIQKSVDNGSETRFNERISKVNRHSDHLELVSNKGESYSCKLLALATGSRGFELQKSLGFETPDSYMGISLNTEVNEDLLDENFPFQYMFHLNPNISPNGPFFFNVGKGRLYTGFMGNKESPDQLKNKLKRILNNYQKIQPYLKGISWDLSRVVVGNISKHPISKMSSDRILILGEAAGLVTAFFYEGMLPALASAHIASKILKPLLISNEPLTSSSLSKYDREIKKQLLDGYFRNGNACEYLFYENLSSLKSIWNAYTEMLVTNKTVRKFVYEVLMLENLLEYKTENDRLVGERLFAQLPFFSKATLWPKFLKAMSF
jgi:flavin-dependent dehydrogenase